VFLDSYEIEVFKDAKAVDIYRYWHYLAQNGVHHCFYIKLVVLDLSIIGGCDE